MTSGYSAFLDPTYATAIGMDAGLLPVAPPRGTGAGGRSRVLDVLSARNDFADAAPGESGARAIARSVRTSALPRVREVRRVQSVPDRPSALMALLSGAVEPRDVAVVEEDHDATQDATRDAARPACTITPLRRAAGLIEVDAACARPAFLVFAERAYPGWSARVDGRPASLQRVYGLVLGLAVGTGQQRIALRYREPSFAPGVIASSVVALLLLLLVAGELRRPRRAAGAA